MKGETCTKYMYIICSHDSTYIRLGSRVKYRPENQNTDECRR